MQLEIKLELKKLIKKNYGFEIEPVVDAKLFEKTADYASPLCFQLARELKKNPMQLAQEIAGELKIKGVERIEALNGYLNFYLSSTVLIKNLNYAVETSFSTIKNHRGERAVVE